jgi:hypothetical protein
MVSELQERQEAEWQVLYDRIEALLKRYGELDYSFDTEVDFNLADENAGWAQQIVTWKLTVLDPEIIK